MKEIIATLMLTMLIMACVPYLSGLPGLAKEDATVIVRCTEDEGGSQLIVVLLDHTGKMSEEEVDQKARLQKIAEIEVDSDCHFTVRAPKTPIEIKQ